jgi:hypothetical protein
VQYRQKSKFFRPFLSLESASDPKSMFVLCSTNCSILEGCIVLLTVLTTSTNPKVLYIDAAAWSHLSCRLLVYLCPCFIPFTDVRL